METRFSYIVAVSKGIFVLALVVIAGWTSCHCIPHMQEADFWHQTGEHQAYPPGRYVIAVGFGDTMDAADDMARGEIAKFFEARVVSVTREEEDYENNKHTFSSRSFVRVRGEAKLEGVEIALRTMDKGVHYSLGVMDKNKLRSRLRKELTFLDLKIEEALHTEQAAAKKRIKALYKVVYLLSQRRTLEHKLNILGYRATLDPNKYEPVYEELERLVADVYPMVVRSGSPEVAAFLVEALTDEGFTVLEKEPETPAVIVAVELKTKRRTTSKMVEFAYELRLVCIGDEKKVAEKRLSERLQHYNKNSARQKAFYEMRDKAVKPFVQDIRRAFLGEPDKTVDKD